MENATNTSKAKFNITVYSIILLALNAAIVGARPLLMLLREYSALGVYALNYLGSLLSYALPIILLSFSLAALKESEYRKIAVYSVIYALFTLARLLSLSIISYSYMLDIGEMWWTVLLAVTLDALIELGFALLATVIAAFALRWGRARSFDEEKRIALGSIVGSLVFFIISFIEQTVAVISFVTNDALGVVYTSEVYSIAFDYIYLLFVLLLSVLLCSAIQKRLARA